MLLSFKFGHCSHDGKDSYTGEGFFPCLADPISDLTPVLRFWLVLVWVVGCGQAREEYVL